MADNITLNAGTGGDTLAADDAGAGGKVQIVKLAIATDGSATPLTADNTDGLLVNLGSNNDVTNAGTFAVQVSSALPAGTNAIGKLAANSGVDIGDVDVTSVSGNVTVVQGTATNLKVDASGVAVPVTDNSGSLTVDFSGQQTQDFDSGAGTQTQAVVGLVVPASGGGVAITGDATNGLDVDVTRVSGDVTVVQATATNLKVDASSVAVPVTDNAGSLTVDYATTGSGNSTGALRVELPTNGTGVIATCSTVTTVTTLTGGGVAHDSGDSGNPIKVGLKAETSPKGVTLVADGDRTDWYADADGLAMVKLNTSNADILFERVSNTDGASTNFTNFSAVASTKNYVTAITVYNSSATGGYVDFRSGSAGSILWTVPAPAGGGVAIASAQPLFSVGANVALAYDVSAALTTVYISVSGFQSKA